MQVSMLIQMTSATQRIGRVVLVRGEPQHQHSKGQNKNRPCYYEKFVPCLVLSAPNLDQDPTQRGHRDIYQVANRKPGRLEIDSDHCADFKINKQKKDVREFSAPLLNMLMKAARADQTAVAPIVKSAK
jgi:hypothetical protein